MRPFALLLLILPFLGGVNAVFAACGVGGGLVAGLISGIVTSLNFLSQQLLLGTDCQDTCRNQGYSYAYWAAGLDVRNLLNIGTAPNTPQGLLGTCWCDNAGLPPNQVRVGLDSVGTCASSITNLIGLRVDYVKPTPVVFDQCYSNSATANTPTIFPAGPGTVTFTTTDAHACWADARCANMQYAAIRSVNVRAPTTIIGGLFTLLIGRLGGTWQCSCSNTPPTTAPRLCHDTTRDQLIITALSHEYDYGWTNYIKPLATAGLRRRTQTPLLPNQKYCPRDLIPCRVLDSEDYECLDTQTELESCGGCVSGVYDNFNKTATIGVDCTRIPGIAPNSVSCIRGECKATKCNRGWTLQKGVCVPRMR